MELVAIEDMVAKLGVPVAITAVFIWIAVRSYLIWETKISVQLDKQDRDIVNVKHCSERTVEILELMAEKQEEGRQSCHDFHQELRHKILNGGEH